MASGVTSYEPETKGILLEGTDFYKFFLTESPKAKISVVNPKIKILNPTSAVSTCSILQQRVVNGIPVSNRNLFFLCSFQNSTRFSKIFDLR